MDSFFIALNVVVPFLIYIFFGYFVRCAHLVEEAFLKQQNQMVFKLFFPIVMFYNLYNKDPNQPFDTKLALISVVCVLSVIAILFVLVPLFVTENPQRGVIIQAIYRSNFVLFALPLTEGLFGRQGNTLASMMIAIVVPIYNVAAVILLEYFRGGKANLSVLIKRILKNPMILGAIVGFVFVLVKIRLPQCIELPISQFSALATPLALFILGGTLHFSSIRNHAALLIPTLVIKLLVLPAIMVGISIFFNFTPLSRFIFFIMFAAPVATASYPMASNMGGDGALAGELVVVSTAVSVVTIFLWIFLLRSTGLI